MQIFIACKKQNLLMEIAQQTIESRRRNALKVNMRQQQCSVR